jgi:hypothetical protein
MSPAFPVALALSTGTPVVATDAPLGACGRTHRILQVARIYSENF